MTEEINMPSFYAIIPAHVRYSKDLEANAKLLYGELTALCNTTGYCWASNQYFADLYGVEIRSIQNWLESLKSHGFIEVELEKKGMKTVRRIWISKEIKEMFATRKEFHGRHAENCTLDMKESSPIIVHSTNTTSLDDDDARKPEKRVPYEIEVTSPSGKKSKITKSEIFSFFVGKPYSPQTIGAAIKRMIEREDRVSDVFQYLESICKSMEFNASKPENTQTKKKKKIVEPEDETPTEHAPGCGAGGWFEAEKRLKEKLKNKDTK